MSETEMSKVNKTIVMRVTPDEAAKLRYQRKFDAAWAAEQVGVREEQLAASLELMRQAEREAGYATGGLVQVPSYGVGPLQMTDMPGIVNFDLFFLPGALAEEKVAARADFEASMRRMSGQMFRSIILDPFSKVAQMKISELIAKLIGRPPVEGELFQETWPDTDEHGVDYSDYGAVFQYVSGNALREDGTEFGQVDSTCLTPVDSWEGAPWA